MYTRAESSCSENMEQFQEQTDMGLEYDNGKLLLPYQQ